MKVLQVAAGLDERGAGPSYSVSRLAQHLQAAGKDTELHCVQGWRAPPNPDLRPTPHRHRQDFAGLPILGGLCFSSELDHRLRQTQRGDIIHTHGLWLMPNVYPAAASRRTGAFMMLSPRGMLGSAALNFSSARKTLFWRLMQARAVATAHCLHATSESECAEIRAMGLRNPIAVIPNGVDVAIAEKPQPQSDRVLLTLGRIHPKKGLDHLIRAWAAVETTFPDWRLRIVGPDEDGYAATLLALARELGIQRLTIEQPLFDDAKLAALQGAEIFVLPTLNENFALTVAEALAAGTPVIASKGSPWQGLEANECGWWVDVGAEPMAAALTHALSRPAQALRAMGENGRRWMAADFSWRRVAARMIEVYDWLTVGAVPPSHVRLS